jgi:transposase
MVKYSSSFKHNILCQYQPKQYGKGFESLARLHNVKGGRQTIQNWYQRWDGTINSLEHKQGAGRPTLLSSAQQKQYVLTPIRKKNTQHQGVNYRMIHENIKSKINKNISLRTIKRYGKEKLNIKKKKTKKYVKHECKFIYHMHQIKQCAHARESIVKVTSTFSLFFDSNKRIM